MTYVAILISMLVTLTAVGWPLVSSSRSNERQPRRGSAWGEA